MVLGLPSVRDRATQMGIEHLINNMIKETERGYLAHSHAHRILTQFNHWTTKAIVSNPLKLPTLCILRLSSTVKDLELDNLLPHYFIKMALPRASGLHPKPSMLPVWKNDKRYEAQWARTNLTNLSVTYICKPIKYSN